MYSSSPVSLFNFHHHLQVDLSLVRLHLRTVHRTGSQPVARGRLQPRHLEPYIDIFNTTSRSLHKLEKNTLTASLYIWVLTFAHRLAAQYKPRHGTDHDAPPSTRLSTVVASPCVTPLRLLCTYTSVGS